MGLLGGLIGSIAKSVSSASGGGNRGTKTKTAEDYSRDYYAARANGDAGGMSAANQAANAIRAQNGQAAQYAGADIAQVQNAYSFKAQQPSYNPNPQMPSYQAPVNYMDVQQEQDRLAMQREEQARQLYDTQVRQGTDRLNAQRGDIGQTSEDASRQAYISYMQGQKAIPQQLASAGITGGAAESTMLGAQTAYQGSLGNIDAAKQKALRDIDTAVTDLANSGDVQKAQYIMANRDKIAENFAQNAYAQIARSDQLVQQNREDGFRDKQYADESAYRDKVYGDNKEQDVYAKRQDAMSNALALAKLTGDYSVMSQYGWTSEQIRAATAQLTSSGGGGGGAGRSGSSGGGSRHVNKQPAAPVSFGDQTKQNESYGQDYDMQSVIDLGLGPIAKSAIEGMIQRGELDAKLVNGKIKVFRVANKPVVPAKPTFPNPFG